MENKERDNSIKNKYIISFVFNSIKPFKGWIIANIFTGTLWAIHLSLSPYVLKKIIDNITHISTEGSLNALINSIIFYILLSIGIVIAFRLHDFILLKLQPTLKRHIYTTLMDRMLEHSPSLVQKHFSGKLANKVQDVVSSIPSILTLTTDKFLNQFVALIIAIFTIYKVNYMFSILLATWVTIFVAVSLLTFKKSKNLCYQSAQIRSGIVGQTVDVLTNLVNVHLFAGSKVESQSLKQRFDKRVEADQTREWWFIKVSSFQGLSFCIYQAICFVLLIYRLKKGGVTVGDFILITSVNASIVHMLFNLSSNIHDFSDYAGSIAQGLEVVLSPISIQDKSDAKELIITKGAIVFDKVNFCYSDSKPIFKNLSVAIEPGKKVGLVGYSGGGKSTFVNLILRLYDTNSGKILIDNQDVKDITQDSLHRSIAMIPQDPSLFNRTLMENIRYGCITATDDQIIEAAKLAHAHDFITKLKYGYDSLVGERGVKLSGGQRQRIAIARAILKNAPILILDEATSQLDSITENEIKESLSGLMNNKTAIVIAHRLSTLTNMDRILVFSDGEIIEDGTHHELLDKPGGLYRAMWDAQVGGFLPN